MNAFLEFKNVLEMGKNIDEFDLLDPLIIEYYSTQGQYDYLSERIILMEGKLGFSKDAIKELISINRPEVFRFRKLYQPYNCKIKIEENKEKIMFKYDNNQGDKECTIEEFEIFDQASKQLILVNGENPTYINVRQDITDIKRILNPVKNDQIIIDELILLSLVNQKYRKSSKSWTLRMHLIKNLSFMSTSSEQFIEQANKELNFCEKCNIHEPRNYYVWMYRQAIVRLSQQIMGKSQFTEFITAEKLRLQEYLENHSFDASAIHYLEWLKNEL